MADPGINLTLSNDGKTVRVLFMSLPGQLTAIEWERLMAILDVMKPTLIEPEASEGAST